MRSIVREYRVDEKVIQIHSYKRDQAMNEVVLQQPAARLLLNSTIVNLKLVWMKLKLINAILSLN